MEYYEQELNGTYTLENTVTETGTTDETVPTSITTTTKDGFTLNTKKSTTDQTIAANGSTVVKLYYDRAKYKLTFAYGVDGLANLESQVKYGAEISAPILHRDGYTFTGWDKTIAKTMPAEAVTYTAQWQENGTHTITYEGLDDSDTQPNTTSFTESGTSFNLTTPTKDGYTFAGWTSSNRNVTFAEDGTVTIPAGVKENITITAHWTQDPVKLLDPNGNTSEELLANTPLPYTISYTDSDETEVNGAIVAYWVDQSGKHYYNGDTVEAGVAKLQAVLMDANTPMEIKSQAQLEKIVENANNPGWLNGNYKLVGHMALSGEWTGIGTSSAPFAGTFDGNNCMITYQNALHPLFNYASNAKIKNLIITGSLTCADQYVGGIVGYADAGCNISNCTVNGGQIIANGSATAYVGGVVGYATGSNELNSLTISDCNVKDMQIVASTAQGCYVGGIAGYLKNGKVDNSSQSYPVYNCTITAAPTSGDAWAGGAVGCSYNSNFSKVYVLDDSIQASSAGNVYSGGIAGEIVVDKEATYTISNCMVVRQSSAETCTACTAETTGTDTAAYAAGVVGRLVFSTDSTSTVKISSLVMTNWASTAKGTTAVAGNVIGEIQSNGKAQNQVVSISSDSAVSATATENDNGEITDNVRKCPSNVTLTN